MNIEVTADGKLRPKVQQLLVDVYGHADDRAVIAIVNQMVLQTRMAFATGVETALAMCLKVQDDRDVELDDEGLVMRQQIERLRDAARLAPVVTT